MLGTAGAAAALAELHGVKSEREMDMDGVSGVLDNTIQPSTY